MAKSRKVFSGKFLTSRLAFYVFAVLGTTALTAPALAAEFAPAINLSSLNGSTGFRLDGGVTANDSSGRSVAGAGDVNGDGFADLIVGAYGADPNGSSSGSSYVVFGKGSGFAASVNLSSLNGSTGLRLDGVAAGDYSGRSVAGAGDVNGDGFADLIVGASGADPNGSASGSSYVVFGKGSGFAAATNLSSLNGSTGFRLKGVAADDRSGQSVAGARDVNGDGFADLIVGALGADPNGSNSGSSYVVFGKGSGFAASVNLSSLNGSTGLRLDGVAVGDRSGQSVAGAGDVNGDGFADLIVGANGADDNSYGTGSSYVVFGNASGSAASTDLSSLDGSTGFRLVGAASDYSGNAVAGAGDVNGDGFADLIVGAHYADPNDDNSGSSYVVFGRASGFAATTDLSSLKGSTGFRLDGVAKYDYSGHSVAGAGDVNGDGFADLIVGAFLADSSSGSSYVVFGRPPDSARTRTGSAASQYISGGAFGDNLNGLEGNDVLEGRAGADAQDGGLGSDTAYYGHAPAGVAASLAVFAGTTGHAAGDTYQSIENLTGSAFADTLTGDAKANIITGGKGIDALRGNGGPDVFNYIRATDSPRGRGRDVIADFNAGTGRTSIDRIDLSAIDAHLSLPGNQAFTYIGTAAFQPFLPGRVRVALAGTSVIVSGDTNGDQIADFEIQLKNVSTLTNLTALDFNL